jgi:hypothetical protein
MIELLDSAVNLRAASSTCLMRCAGLILAAGLRRLPTAAAVAVAVAVVRSLVIARCC